MCGSGAGTAAAVVGFFFNFKNLTGHFRFRPVRHDPGDSPCAPQGHAAVNLPRCALSPFPQDEEDEEDKENELDEEDKLE